MPQLAAQVSCEVDHRELRLDLQLAQNGRRHTRGEQTGKRVTQEGFRLRRGQSQQSLLGRGEVLPRKEVHGNAYVVPCELRAVPVTRGVEHGWPADAEVRPQQRTANADRLGAGRPQSEFHILRYA